MADPKNPEKTDWTKVDARIKAKEGSAPKGEVVPVPVDLPEIQEALPTHSGPLAIAVPDTEAARGIIMQWRKNKIDRQTALKAIQAKYDAQLDALSYQLRKAVTVSNARADLIAEEFLAKLNMEHVRVMIEFGVRNTDGRADALMKVRQVIAAKLYEVQQKNWPQALIDRCIDDILELEKRACAEMMKELGA